MSEDDLEMTSEYGRNYFNEFFRKHLLKPGGSTPREPRKSEPIPQADLEAAQILKMMGTISVGLPEEEKGFYSLKLSPSFFPKISEAVKTHLGLTENPQQWVSLRLHAQEPIVDIINGGSMVRYELGDNLSVEGTRFTQESGEWESAGNITEVTSADMLSILQGALDGMTSSVTSSGSP